MQTAFALEAVLDEAVFILGPILVTVLATAWHPVAGIAVAIVACVGGTLALHRAALDRAARPPADQHVGPAAADAVADGHPARRGLRVPSACCSAPPRSRRSRSPTSRATRRWSGGLLALWALGSLTAGVITGAVHWRRGPSFRVRWGALAMACAMAPLYFIGSLPLMGAHAVRRRLRDRADDDRRDVADRGSPCRPAG